MPKKSQINEYSDLWSIQQINKDKPKQSQHITGRTWEE